MNLHWINTDDPRAEIIAHVAELEKDPDHSETERLSAIAVTDLLDALESCEGPTKWVKLHHYRTLEFFAYDPTQLAEDERQFHQLIIHVHRRYCDIRYKLPHEHRPWTWAIAYSGQDTPVKLTLDAFSRCESRREELVRRYP